MDEPGRAQALRITSRSVGASSELDDRLALLWGPTLRLGLAGIAGVAQMVFALVAMWRLPPEELGPRTGIPARWHFAIGGLLIANATLLVIGMSDSALILAPIFLLAGGVTDILGVVEWRRIDSDVASEEQAE